MQKERQKSAQAAVEYAMVAAFALLIIIPATYFFYSYSHSAQQRINEAQLAKLGRDITNNAESIYYLGYPSQITLEEQMPAGIRHISVYRDWNKKVNELNFQYYSGSGYAENSFPSRINIMGFFENTSWTEGTKNVRLFASRNNTGAPYVLVTFVGDCAFQDNYNSDGIGAVDELDFAVCSSCLGQQASGACEPCDYNGNCKVDWADLVMWKILVNGNNPPKAEITGPATATAGLPATYTIQASDVDSNLNHIELYATPAASELLTTIGSCDFAEAETSTCAQAWTPATAGTYYLIATARDSTAAPGTGLCSGNPFGLSSGMADCGFKDYVTVTVS
ncbi:hypothetical protein HYV82_05905 [Candidatus Woesearchaeota archaeon]|nr:hypothetical protein [Candidatus Woesearchaeota archaeon]